MKAKYILAALCAASTVAASASTPSECDKWAKWGPRQEDGKLEYKLRLGYTIGGTTPLPLPAEIRAIKGFGPNGGGTVAFDITRMYSKRWGLNTGLHLFMQGFHTEAEVKGYKMSLEQEGNVMAGYFTGTDVTDMTSWGMTIPVQASLRLSPRWNVSLGPYVTYYFKSEFSGEVYDNSEGVGYIRVDDPTGTRVTIDKENPATYDFSDNMRSWGAGLELTFDWKACRHLNVFGMVDWGLTDAVDPNFDAVAFKMYPIYATLGLAYRF